APVLQKLVSDPALRGAALRGLGVYDDPKTPEVILAAYPALNTAEKRDALGTLTARPAYGKALLDAVSAKKVPAADVSADLVRQLRSFNNAELDKRIGDVWGLVRATPAERARQMAALKRMLTAPYQTP